VEVSEDQEGSRLLRITLEPQQYSQFNLSSLLDRVSLILIPIVILTSIMEVRLMVYVLETVVAMEFVLLDNVSAK
jgi:hypothetical protein